MNFGKIIKQKRLEKDMSQSKLSELTDIPQTTISDLERGRYMPDIDKGLRIAKALDISITELLEERAE